MHAAVEAAVCLTAVATVPTSGRVVCKRRGINDETAAVGEDCATSRSAAVTGVMCAKAGRAKRITAIAAGCSSEMKRGVSNSRAGEAIHTTAISAAARVRTVTTGTGVSTMSSGTIKRSVIDRDGSGAEPRAATLRRSTRTAICLTVLILITAVAASGGAVVDARQVDVQRAAFEIDRTTFSCGGVSVIEIPAVATKGRIAGEAATRNDDVAGCSETGERATSCFERGVLIHNAVAFA